MENFFEAIGLLVDKADNLLEASKLPLAPGIHITCLTGGLEEIRNTLKQLYIEKTGENPWA